VGGLVGKSGGKSVGNQGENGTKGGAAAAAAGP